MLWIPQAGHSLRGLKMIRAVLCTSRGSSDTCGRRIDQVMADLDGTTVSRALTVPLQTCGFDRQAVRQVSLQKARRKRYVSAGTGVEGGASWEPAHPACSSHIAPYRISLRVAMHMLELLPARVRARLPTHLLVFRIRVLCILAR